MSSRVLDSAVSIHQPLAAAWRPLSPYAASTVHSCRTQLTNAFPAVPDERNVALLPTPLLRLVLAMRDVVGQFCNVVGRPLSARPDTTQLLRPLNWISCQTRLTGCANTNSI